MNAVPAHNLVEAGIGTLDSAAAVWTGTHTGTTQVEGEGAIHRTEVSLIAAAGKTAVDIGKVGEGREIDIGVEAAVERRFVGVAEE